MAWNKAHHQVLVPIRHTERCHTIRTVTLTDDDGLQLGAEHCQPLRYGENPEAHVQSCQVSSGHREVSIGFGLWVDQLLCPVEHAKQQLLRAQSQHLPATASHLENAMNQWRPYHSQLQPAMSAEVAQQLDPRLPRLRSLPAHRRTTSAVWTDIPLDTPRQGDDAPVADAANDGCQEGSQAAVATAHGLPSSLQASQLPLAPAYAAQLSRPVSRALLPQLQQAQLHTQCQCGSLPLTRRSPLEELEPRATQEPAGLASSDASYSASRQGPPFNALCLQQAGSVAATWRQGQGDTWHQDLTGTPNTHTQAHSRLTHSLLRVWVSTSPFVADAESRSASDFDPGPLSGFTSIPITPASTQRSLDLNALDSLPATPTALRYDSLGSDSNTTTATANSGHSASDAVSDGTPARSSLESEGGAGPWAKANRSWWQDGLHQALLGHEAEAVSSSQGGAGDVKCASASAPCTVSAGAAVTSSDKNGGGDDPWWSGYGLAEPDMAELLPSCHDVEPSQHALAHSSTVRGVRCGAGDVANKGPQAEASWGGWYGQQVQIMLQSASALGDGISRWLD